MAKTTQSMLPLLPQCRGSCLLLIHFGLLWFATGSFQNHYLRPLIRTQQLVFEKTHDDPRGQPLLPRQHGTTSSLSLFSFLGNNEIIYKDNMTLITIDDTTNSMQQTDGPHRHRRQLLVSSFVAVAATLGLRDYVALAAPPIFVIAEEMGYFPVQNRKGEVSYIPRPVRRHSSEQAIALAQYLQKVRSRAVMALLYVAPLLFLKFAGSRNSQPVKSSTKFCLSKHQVGCGHVWCILVSSLCPSTRIVWS